MLLICLIIGPILFFLGILSFLFFYDRHRNKSTIKIVNTLPSHAQPAKKTNKILLFLSINGFILLIATLLLWRLFLLPSNSNQNKDRTLTKEYFSHKNSPSTLLSSPHDHDTYYRSLQSQEKYLPFEKTFSPSTIPFSMLRHAPEEGNYHPIAQLQGAQGNEFFICSYYDILTQGTFWHSPQLVVIPDTTIQTRTISVRLFLPYLEVPRKIIIPTLINSFVTAAYPQNNEYSLSSQGTLILRDSNLHVFDYTITLFEGNPLIRHESSLNPWLQQEFKRIPPQIKKLLDKVRNQPQEIRIETIALIMTGYFGYQSSDKRIILPLDKSWMNLLNDTLSSNSIFYGDCDVLSTYAFIFLKYLDLHPLFLVGFFNTPPTKNTLDSQELHALLYLQTEAASFFFDPTLFVRILPHPEQETSLPHGSFIEHPSQKDLNRNGIQAVETNALPADFFTLSPQIVSKIRFSDPCENINNLVSSLLISSPIEIIREQISLVSSVLFFYVR